MEKKICAVVAAPFTEYALNDELTRSRQANCRSLLKTTLNKLYDQHQITDFWVNMELGPETIAAEEILRMKQTLPVSLTCVLPSEEQAIDWLESQRDRYFSIVAQCDEEHLFSTHADPNTVYWCCNYMIEHCNVVLEIHSDVDSSLSPLLLQASQQEKPIVTLDLSSSAAATAVEPIHTMPALRLFRPQAARN